MLAHALLVYPNAANRPLNPAQAVTIGIVLRRPLTTEVLLL